jgi:PAS domain S-box-containing protein
VSAKSFIPTKLLYEAIVDSSEDAIVSKDLQSIVKSWNQGAERDFGYSAEEMVGQSISKLLPPDRRDEEAQILARLQRGERVEHFETTRQRRDGKIIDVSLTISPIRNSQGVIVGASKIARDITEQKEALRQLAEAHEELQRADRVKAEFLATLSHELRTPLNAILGWSQILKEGATWDDIAQGIRVIERNVRMQSQMIEDLLDMSRIESGKVSLDVQRVDLAAVVGAGFEPPSIPRRSRSANLRPTKRIVREKTGFSRSCGTCWQTRSSLRPRKAASTWW